LNDRNRCIAAVGAENLNGNNGHVRVSRLAGFTAIKRSQEDRYFKMAISKSVGAFQAFQMAVLPALSVVGFLGMRTHATAR
jgi:hypothetical protein